MAATIAIFFKLTAGLSFVFLLFGLYEPWWVLWWKATQNRLKVIKLYGGITAVSYLLSNLFALI
jgi:hypothetical protein